MDLHGFFGKSKRLGDDGTSSVKRSRPRKMLNWFLGDCDFGATSDSQNIHGICIQNLHLVDLYNT